MWSKPGNQTWVLSLVRGALQPKHCTTPLLTNVCSIDLMLNLTALPEEVIKIGKDIKPVIDIKQTGEHFVIVVKTSQQTVTNEFTVGKEAEITSMDGKKLKCTVQLEDGKLVCKLKSFTHIQEVQGNEMIEVSRRQ
uniref:Fatty acid-binding protein, liver n=1 Tax=Callorhinchus milii TaxID=7868 RepID=A0A4W3JFE1_CALMI